jgi:DNA primase
MNRPGGRSPAADDALERVRAASDIVEVVSQYVSLRKVGRSWKGLCPFHQEKTPSFTVSPERQTYHCFGCGKGGDVFGFVEEAEKVEFAEALRVLADRAGIELPARRASAESNEGLYEACGEAAEFYRRSLLDPSTGRKARDFLDRRGIQPEAQERFGLGYAPAGWDALGSRLADRFGEGLLVRAGLAIEREGRRGVYDRFRDRVVVPLRLGNGRVVGFGGRTLGDEDPKYLNSPETPVYRKGRFLFGLGEAREALRTGGEGILVEGYFDVIGLAQEGFPETVAVAGTALTPEQAGLLARYAGRVCLVLDGDAAGEAASKRALAPLLGAGLEVRVGRLPAGEDPDSFVRGQGHDAFARVREAAESPVAYLCRPADEGGAGHGRAVRAVIELARSLTDLARREALLVEADRKLGVGLERLRRAVEQEAARQRSVVREPAPATGAGGEARAERPADAGPVPFLDRSLLGLLVSAPELAEAAVARIAAAWITHPTARAAWEVVERDTGGGPARWCEAAAGEARALLSGLASEATAPDSVQRALEDHALRLEERALEAEREAIRRDLVVQGGRGALAGRDRLERLQWLASRLHGLRTVGAAGGAAVKGDAE